MRVPVASNPDGTPITGLVSLGICRSRAHQHPTPERRRYTGASTTYPTANTNNKLPFPDGFLPTLTVRDREPHPRVPISNTQWAFGSCPGGAVVVPSETQICLLGAGFQPNRLYEVIYRAKDPIVMGLGYAGLRDLIAFFKHSAQDDAGNAEPAAVAGGSTKAVFSGSSQSGRNMRTFLHLGFNQDEARRVVFEGAFPTSAAGGPISTAASARPVAHGATPTITCIRRTSSLLPTSPRSTRLRARRRVFWIVA